MRLKLTISIISAFLIFIFSCGNSNDDSRLVIGTKNVTANGGLRMRGKPDLTGKRIITIPNGSDVEIIEEKESNIVISGKTGRWTKVIWNKKTGWVFGGFLSKEEVSKEETSVSLPKNIIGNYCSFAKVKFRMKKNWLTIKKNIIYRGNGGRKSATDYCIVKSYQEQTSTIIISCDAKKKITKKDIKYMKPSIKSPSQIIIKNGKSKLIDINWGNETHYVKYKKK